MIGIAPAAGYATRLGRLASSKEMLEVDGAPAIEHLVRRLETGGCTEIRVVTRPEKEDLRAYATRRGLHVVLGYPRHVGESIAIGLEGCDDDSLVALGYPDTLWQPLDAFVSVRSLIDNETDVGLGLFGTPDAYRSDVVVTDDAGRVLEIAVKPLEPPSRRIWGILVARRSMLRGIGNEEWPSKFLRPLIERGRVASVYLSDEWLDIGTPASLARALRSAGAAA